MSGETSVLTVSDLSYHYGSLLVFEDVSFSVEAGEQVLLTGLNGAGKSTLLRCLAGIDAPSSGEILIGGSRLTGTSRKLRGQLSFVPDTPPFYADLTAEEHVQFILKANRADERFEYTHRLIEAFELQQYLRHYPSTFSRGMRQKLALIIALLLKPRLLLLDEPFAFLDKKAAAVLGSELAGGTNDGAAVVLSSHQDVPQLSFSKTLLLGEGRITQTGRGVPSDSLQGNEPDRLSSLSGQSSAG